MSEHTSDVVRPYMGKVGGGGEDRRASQGFIVTEPATAAMAFYTTPAQVPGAGITIDRGVPALVWQGSAAATIAANVFTFDRSAKRWTTFTLVGSGGHYVAPSDQIATIAGSNEIVGLEYVIRTTARRWQPRATGPSPITFPYAIRSWAGVYPGPAQPNGSVIRSCSNIRWANAPNGSGYWTSLPYDQQPFPNVTGAWDTNHVLWSDAAYIGDSGTAGPLPDGSPASPYGLKGTTSPVEAFGTVDVWHDAVLSILNADNFLPIPGSEIIWDSNPVLGTTQSPSMFYRHFFTLPRLPVTATLKWAAWNSNVILLINGVEFTVDGIIDDNFGGSGSPSWGDSHSPVAPFYTYTLDPAVFTTGENLLAGLVTNYMDGKGHAPSPTIFRGGLSYEIEFT